ncbi:MAG: sigma-54 dependent transcriptional regulator [Pseudomonadota bacterium]
MSTKRTLIVDDEPDIRELLEITLGRMKLATVAAADLQQAYALLEQDSFDLCLTDMHLPDGNGLELVEHINQQYPHLPVAMITAFGSMDTAIAALKAGAFDFLQKPIDLDQLRSLVDGALKMADLDQHPEAQEPSGPQLLGDSDTMVQLRSQIKKLSRSLAPIYISGESGSGKEVAARLIHAQGPRQKGPFVPVNCGAIPSELMESEFFGHVKGSFTGAVSDKQGLFQAASGGTLFLDEVADLPLSMQVKLLRAIQEKAVRPVGSHSEDVTDVRILSATHKDLVAEVAADRFRQDLYYRLNVIELRMPALRDHADDLAALIDSALARLAKEYGGTAPSLDPAAMQALEVHTFPGNVRELENILERAFTLCENNLVTVADLQLSQGNQAHSESAAGIQEPTQPAEAEPLPAPTAEDKISDDAVPLELPPGASLEDFLENIERQLITRALDNTRWNKTAAAKELGITFRALRYKLKKLEME